MTEKFESIPESEIPKAQYPAKVWSVEESQKMRDQLASLMGPDGKRKVQEAADGARKAWEAAKAAEKPQSPQSSQAVPSFSEPSVEKYPEKVWTKEETDRLKSDIEKRS